MPSELPKPFLCGEGPTVPSILHQGLDHRGQERESRQLILENGVGNYPLRDTPFRDHSCTQMIWTRSRPRPVDFSFLPTSLNIRSFLPSSKSSLPRRSRSLFAGCSA